MSGGNSLGSSANKDAEVEPDDDDIELATQLFSAAKVAS
jgi:hypothetical protein